MSKFVKWKKEPQPLWWLVVEDTPQEKFVCELMFESDADDIIRTHNAHPLLVEVAETAFIDVKWLLQDLECTCDHCNDERDFARAVQFALAAAKGEKEPE